MDEPCRIPLRARDGTVRAWALVDAEDYPRVNEYRWHLTFGFACGSAGRGTTKVMLHRLITGLDGRRLRGRVQFINGDKLDCRRSNLTLDRAGGILAGDHYRVPLRDLKGVAVAWTRVDEADYPKVAGFRWHLTCGYASAYSGEGRGQRLERRMHRLVLGLPDDDPREGEHRNRDRLDNRRANLLVVTRGQNAQNLPPMGRTSRHRGVYWSRWHRRWIARHHLNGRNRYIGSFVNEEDAALAAAAFRREHMPYAVG